MSDNESPDEAGQLGWQRRLERTRQSAGSPGGKGRSIPQRWQNTQNRPDEDTEPPRKTERPSSGRAGNPYAAPTAHVRDIRTGEPASDTLADEPNKVAAGRGFAWWSEGWRLFREAPGLWIGIGVTLMLINIGLSLIPVAGNLASSLVFPLFTAGLMLGCHSLESGETLSFSHLFAGFRNNPVRLIMIGLLYGLGMVIVVVIFVFGFSGSFIGALAGHWGGAAEVLFLAFGFVVLIALIFALTLSAFFAPALVVLHELTAFEAMKLSFRGMNRNWLPFLAYSIAFIALAVLASLPVGLGWLVLVPVLFCCIYASYRDIFIAET